MGLLPGTLEAVEPAETRWVVMEGEEAVDNPVLRQEVPPDFEPLVRKTTGGRRHRLDVQLLLDATMCPDTHRSVHLHMHWHCCRGGVLTVTASGATFAVAAFAADAAPAGWRTGSRWKTRRPRIRTPHSGYRPAACEDRLRRSY